MFFFLFCRYLYAKRKTNLQIGWVRAEHDPNGVKLWDAKREKVKQCNWVPPRVRQCYTFNSQLYYYWRFYDTKYRGIICGGEWYDQFTRAGQNTARYSQLALCSQYEYDSKKRALKCELFSCKRLHLMRFRIRFEQIGSGMHLLFMRTFAFNANTIRTYQLWNSNSFHANSYYDFCPALVFTIRRKTKNLV